MNPICVETGIDTHINDFILSELRSKSYWGLSIDHHLSRNFLSKEELKDHSDSGMLMTSFHIEREQAVNNSYGSLNYLAALISHVVMQKQDTFTYDSYSMLRVLWNYYNRGSSGVTHTDSDNVNGKNISIIYYLNECDGGTEIEGKRYFCSPGRALIFNPSTLHKGFGPYTSKHKFVLNLVLNTKNLKLKSRSNE